MRLYLGNVVTLVSVRKCFYLSSVVLVLSTMMAAVIIVKLSPLESVKCQPQAVTAAVEWNTLANNNNNNINNNRRHGNNNKFSARPPYAAAAATSTEQITERTTTTTTERRINYFGAVLPVMYIYDSYVFPSSAWWELLSDRGNLTLRGTELDAIYIGLLVESAHRNHIKKSHFDGFYTYFGINGFSFGSSWKNWRDLNKFANQNGLLFIPSLGPGYIDTQAMERGEHATPSPRPVLRGGLAQRPQQRRRHGVHHLVQRVARGHPDRARQAREQSGLHLSGLRARGLGLLSQSDQVVGAAVHREARLLLRRVGPQLDRGELRIETSLRERGYIKKKKKIVWSACLRMPCGEENK
ncbi:unnamed protein product [Trichogramma brassicae]|uniref:Uncharacterized protein n=1 Tax=Trichogramma brassicae TaxID=86971 RepID=A0A6H5I913_9HYME|nr:unnamed protein product [Trichogramma brassicae]